MVLFYLVKLVKLGFSHAYEASAAASGLYKVGEILWKVLTFVVVLSHVERVIKRRDEAV